MARQNINVASLIDEQPLRAFHIGLVVLVFLIMISDGYDQMVVGFAAAGMVRDLHFARSVLGPIFSASLIGMLVGGPLFGWVGDRYGRRVTIVSGVMVYGIVSLAMGIAHNEWEIFALRFLTGLGLGGVPANAIALIAEYAPKRIRATLIMLAQLGLTFGAMLAAAVSGFLEASHGWRALFYLGGIAPIAIAWVLVAALPESLKFLAARHGAAGRMARVIHRIDPSVAIAENAVFVLGEEVIEDGRRFGLGKLFAGGLIWITPLVWILFNTFLAGNYFLHSWIPILFRDRGLSIGQTALVMAMYDVGGVLGVLTITRFIDRFGVAAIVALYVISFPAVAAIGMIGHTVAALGTVIFLAGFCMVGITLGMNAVAGVIYPTEMRAKGVGWAYGVGRIGSMTSPWIGGWLVGMHLPMSQLFLAPAIPMGIGAVLSFILMRLCVKRFGGYVLSA